MQLGLSQPKNEEERDSDDNDNDDGFDDVTHAQDPYSTKHPGRRIALGLRKLSAVEVATSAASRRRSSASSTRLAELQDRRMSNTLLKFVRISDEDLQKMGLGRLTPRQGPDKDKSRTNSRASSRANANSQGLEMNKHKHKHKHTDQSKMAPSDDENMQQPTTVQTVITTSGLSSDGASAEDDDDDDSDDDDSDDEDAMTELNNLHYAAAGGGPVVDDYAKDVYNQRGKGKDQLKGSPNKGISNRGKGSGFDMSIAVEAEQRDHSYDTDGGVLAMHETIEGAVQVKPLRREDWDEDSDIDLNSHVGEDSNDELVLEDWEWDSDADENNDGEWLKVR